MRLEPIHSAFGELLGHGDDDEVLDLDLVEPILLPRRPNVAERHNSHGLVLVENPGEFLDCRLLKTALDVPVRRRAGSLDGPVLDGDEVGWQVGEPGARRSSMRSSDRAAGGIWTKPWAKSQHRPGIMKAPALAARYWPSVVAVEYTVNRS
jgi:hypothetical protein